MGLRSGKTSGKRANRVYVRIDPARTSEKIDGASETIMALRGGIRLNGTDGLVYDGRSVRASQD